MSVVNGIITGLTLIIVVLRIFLISRAAALPLQSGPRAGGGGGFDSQFHRLFIATVEVMSVLLSFACQFVARFHISSGG